MALFEYKQADREYYNRNIRGFLPEHIIDVHTHIYKKEFRIPGVVDKTKRSQDWPSLVADQNPIEDLLETYRILLPDYTVTPVLFGSVAVDYDTDRSNDYVSACAKDKGFPALYCARPEESADRIIGKIRAGGFCGVKVYLNFAPSYLPKDEIRIFDFLPHHQLEALDAEKLIVMLHIPRSGRLRDPVNIAQMLEIDSRYPGIKLIIAHVGRAYAIEDLGDSLERLARSKMMFDFSANTNQQVFEALIRHIGPDRIMFGADLPVLRMRMRRIVENGVYINVVPRGLYGNVSEDPHMREINGAEADMLSFFFYEEIAAMRRAAEKEQLTHEEIKRMFFANAASLFDIKLSKV
jgi:predicted TIM-barrel fold metal-dependent hydrolase